ncbi:unnamed protein product [Bursaphelenchus okinawaensis]|uniref:Uncharacterized protein n=1 Tax=Bursaphelenchus okinawaensis TaxID=465554 RepID=A0A811LDB2_9BILA|nr:unnamed protein product [Bursaphelenchus okinawaensis]CAG9120575.1 unnamed protein product [Bursaphelenchus okinawaensis]
MSWKETDPVALWKTSSVIPNTPEVNVFDKGQPNFDIQKTRLWKSLREMSSTDQVDYMQKVIKNWPYRSERWAMEMAQHPVIFGSALSSFYITNRVAANIFLNKPKAGILETMRTTSKAPLFVMFYASAFMSYGFWEVLVRSKFMDTQKPCASCLLSTGVTISVCTGTLFPLIGSPILCYGILLRQLGDDSKYASRNLFEAFALCNEFTKYVKPKMPFLIALQAGLAATAIYAHDWANQKIFNTFDVDPEIVTEAVNYEEPYSKWKSGLDTVIHTLQKPI